ncbi:glycosyltransferase family 2 protein [Bradyrhizobium guangzhouense]|uniref:Glycosyltransferase family 2 protein n=1 Tax=Bradyrhizobium guangzhouense TaxID=1325095 RepID=A0AAE6CAQ7_9BRAD|nr:glycosyltransferase family 2 protein [Bradyrhizobium guangzhouense]QAU48882.1 glycosyltransferase family 2 protein [Bradyrhizobium guangzhouense]RXH06892.1 glycosyltransferase family 2 protein [Bradyrhizobium guangzhouense]
MQVRSALQINLHPLDVRHAVHTLPHQLGVWGDQVDRIVFTVDTRQSKSGRYTGGAYEESRGRLFALLEDITRKSPKAEISEVDYSPAALAAVRQRYFSTSSAYPEKAFDGGPFHAYFHGLLKANAEYVVHMDSDMLFGGGSQVWLEEAIGWLKTTPDALFAGPLPGPPRADGTLGDLHGAFPGLSGIRPPERLAADYPAYRFRTVSTRIFVLDQTKFDASIGALELVRPNLKRRIRARLFRQSPLTMPAEEIISAAMMRNGLSRIDFLGSGAGLYSLHPPYRTDTFYRELPQLIARIVAGQIPDAQRGDYDVNSSMFDWSEALRQKTVSRRLVRAARTLMSS